MQLVHHISLNMLAHTILEVQVVLKRAQAQVARYLQALGRAKMYFLESLVALQAAKYLLQAKQVPAKQAAPLVQQKVHSLENVLLQVAIVA